MFSWIHYPELLSSGERAMRRSVFWTLALSVILSGMMYTLSATARDVQAQELLEFDQSAQDAEEPPEDARQPVGLPDNNAEQPVGVPPGDAQQDAEGEPVEGPPNNAEQPVETPSAETPTTLTLGDFLRFLPEISTSIETAEVEGVLQSLPDSFESEPVDLGSFVGNGAEESVDVESVLRESLPEADPQELESVLGALPKEFKYEPVSVEGLKNLAEEDLVGSPQQEAPQVPEEQEELPGSPEAGSPDPGEVQQGSQPEDAVDVSEESQGQVIEDPGPGSDSEGSDNSGSGEDKASSPECKAAAERFDEARNEASSTEEIPSQLVADYENKCFDGTATIDLGDAASGDDIKESTKVILSYSVPLGVIGATSGVVGTYYTYLSYKATQAGAPPPT